jgi:sulfur carrier protein
MSAGRITINGERRDLATATVEELLRHEGLDPGRRGLAVAINGAVVPRANWNDRAVQDGDDVEIVKPFAGG